MDLATFGKNVQQAREKLGKETQTSFAEKLGVSQVTLSRLERGLGGDIKTLFAIVAYYRQKGYPAHLLFRENFSSENFTKEKKNKTKTGDSLSVFGKHLERTREEVLHLDKLSFSRELNTTARLYGRLEDGIGGNIHMVFAIIESLNERGFKGECLFMEPFSIDHFYADDPKVLKKNEVIAALQELKKEFDEKIEALMEQLGKL